MAASHKKNVSISSLLVGAHRGRAPKRGGGKKGAVKIPKSTFGMPVPAAHRERGSVGKLRTAFMSRANRNRY